MVTKVQARHMRKLIEALRSGEYKQGRASLCSTTKNGKEYCCLGVACAISGLVKLAKAHAGLFSDLYFVDKKDSRNTNQFSLTGFEHVQAYFGFIDMYGVDIPVEWLPKNHSYRVSCIHETASLIELNDNGVSFKQIARLLEKWLKREEDTHE